MRKHPVVLVSILLLAVLAGVLYFTRGTPKSAAPQAIPVKVVKVLREDVPISVSGIGSVLSLHSVQIRPQVDGVLTRLLVREGQHVDNGQLLATIDDRAIRAALGQATAQLAQTRAQLEVAQVNLKRYQLLVVDHGVSQQEYDDQQAQVHQLQATLQGNQAAVDAQQVQLSYTRILSPVSGRVGIRNVDEGTFLRTTDTLGLFSVTQIDPIAVEFSLPQQWLPTLQTLVRQQPAAKVQASVGNPAEDNPPLAEGTLSLIDNQVSGSTGTLRAKAEFANAEERLWPGQLVTIKLQTQVRKDALVVPPGVVQRGLDSHFVYRVLPASATDTAPKVEAVPVQVLYQDSRLNVLSGVNPGDTLVSDGQSRLKPGVAVHLLGGADDKAVADNEARP